MLTGRQFIQRVRRYARRKGLPIEFISGDGPGSHGTLYLGGQKTTVKDRKKEIGRGLLKKMCNDLNIDSKEIE